VAAYNDKGVKVIEFDNITPQGWIEEIKIQKTDAEEVVAQLRRQADFAKDYGLQGVQYSVDPPDIADEVELLVADYGRFPSKETRAKKAGDSRQRRLLV
jgi:hypothetical protein